MQGTRKMPAHQGEQHQQQDISTGQCCSCKILVKIRILFKRTTGEHKEKVLILLSEEEKWYETNNRKKGRDVLRPVHCSNTEEDVREDVATSPGYHSPRVKWLEENEDAAVLCVVQDQCPVQLSQRIVLPALPTF